MTVRSRNALPSIPVASLVDRNDTTAQADENNRRVTAYVGHLETHRLPLPADPQQPQRLSIIEAARESGLHLRSLRPGARSRRVLDEYQRQVGVAIIVKHVAASLTIEEFVQRLPLLAARAAKHEGTSIDVMKSRLDDAASIITRRASRQKESLAGPLISSMIDDIDHGSLELPENLSRLMPNLVPWCDGLNDL